MKHVEFEESQRFTQKWVWIIVILPLLVWVVAFIQQVILRKPFGNHPASDLGLVLFGVICAATILFFARIRLKTRVSDEGIYYRVTLLQFRDQFIAKEQIAAYEVRKYHAVREFGGYGIRYGGRKYGKAFNMSGNMGLQLVLQNGQKILIGTQKPDELRRVMDRLMQKPSA